MFCYIECVRDTWIYSNSILVSAAFYWNGFQTLFDCGTSKNSEQRRGTPNLFCIILSNAFFSELCSRNASRKTAALRDFEDFSIISF